MVSLNLLDSPQYTKMPQTTNVWVGETPWGETRGDAIPHIEQAFLIGTTWSSLLSEPATQRVAHLREGAQVNEPHQGDS